MCIQCISRVGNYFTWKRIAILFVFVTFAYFMYICFSVSATSGIRKLSGVMRYESQSLAYRKVKSYMFQDTKYEPGVCNLPKLQPFHESIRNYVGRRPKNFSCKQNSLLPLMFDTDLVSKLIQLEPPEKFGFRNCCYSQLIYQNRKDNTEKFADKCIPIVKNETEIPSSVDFFQISCVNMTTTADKKVLKKGVVVDMFAFARLSNQSHNRLKKISQRREQKDPTFTKRDKLNVVIFGFDAVSHMNLQRIMPKSYKFIINDLEAIGLNGYVKTGENTFPNMVSILMGMDEKEVEKKYWKGNTPKFIDKLPLVWKEYNDQGYATSFGEDSPWMGVFMYGKRGFKVPPVDMYLRPLTRKMARGIGHTQPGLSKLCYGSRLSIDVLMNYMKKTATTMAALKQKYFQLIWASALFHDDNNLGMIADDEVLNHLKWYLSGTLNNTILILMSDHGNRYSSLRSVNQGQIEDRMPFLYFVFPEWFRQKYKLAMKNLRGNEDKLTSHYDLHQTLRDFINTTTITDEKISFRTMKLNKQLRSRNISKVSKGISLFLPISKIRSCRDAGIPDRWCVCFRLAPTKPEDNYQILSAAQLGVAQINSILSKPKDVLTVCHKLQLESVSNAENIILDYQGDIKHPVSGKVKTANESLVLINFITKPGMGLFEGQFRRTLPLGRWKVDGVIARINSYGNQSHCVENHKNRRILKQYCNCRPLKKLKTTSTKKPAKNETKNKKQVTTVKSRYNDTLYNVSFALTTAHNFSVKIPMFPHVK